MGYFYFDESIHERAEFILGAFVYSGVDLTPMVFEKLRQVGLQPGVDEFKSSSIMSTNMQQRKLRNLLKSLLWDVKIGLVVIPCSERQRLGSDALRGLNKIIEVNRLADRKHHAYFDEGINFQNLGGVRRELNLDRCCVIHPQENSCSIGGIQLADLVAHTLSTMLLETLGLISKKVKAGPNSGYDPDMDIELGFELWATLRYHFFTQDQIDIDVDPLEGFSLDVGSYAVYFSNDCSEKLKGAVIDRFGSCYMGCIH